MDTVTKSEPVPINQELVVSETTEVAPGDKTKPWSSSPKLSKHPRWRHHPRKDSTEEAANTKTPIKPLMLHRGGLIMKSNDVAIYSFIDR